MNTQKFADQIVEMTNNAKYGFASLSTEKSFDKFKKTFLKGYSEDEKHLVEFTQLNTYEKVGVNFNYASAINGRIAKLGEKPDFEALPSWAKPYRGSKVVLQSVKDESKFYLNLQITKATSTHVVFKGSHFSMTKAEMIETFGESAFLSSFNKKNEVVGTQLAKGLNADNQIKIIRPALETVTFIAINGKRIDLRQFVK